MQSLCLIKDYNLSHIYSGSIDHETSWTLIYVQESNLMKAIFYQYA